MTWTLLAGSLRRLVLSLCHHVTRSRHSGPAASGRGRPASSVGFSAGPCPSASSVSNLSRPCTPAPPLPLSLQHRTRFRQGGETLTEPSSLHPTPHRPLFPSLSHMLRRGHRDLQVAQTSGCSPPPSHWTQSTLSPSRNGGKSHEGVPEFRPRAQGEAGGGAGLPGSMRSPSLSQARRQVCVHVRGGGTVGPWEVLFPWL